MDYYVAAGVAQALGLLAEHKAWAISGGTTVLPALKFGKDWDGAIVDLFNIRELKKIEVRGQYLVIGAETELSAISRHPAVRTKFPALAEAARAIGSLQIRNMATLAGNVLNGRGNADGHVALSVLAPQFTICSSKGEKRYGLEELYTEKRVAVDRTKELVTEIWLPLPKDGETSAFVRSQPREGFVRPDLNIAVRIGVENGKVSLAEIAVGTGHYKPCHLYGAERALIGRAFSREQIDETIRNMEQEECGLKDDIYSSGDYKKKILPVLVKRGLMEIQEDLGGRYTG